MSALKKVQILKGERLKRETEKWERELRMFPDCVLKSWDPMTRVDHSVDINSFRDDERVEYLGEEDNPFDLSVGRGISAKLSKEVHVQIGQLCPTSHQLRIDRIVLQKMSEAFIGDDVYYFFMVTAVIK